MYAGGENITMYGDLPEYEMEVMHTQESIFGGGTARYARTVAFAVVVPQQFRWCHSLATVQVEE